MQAHLHHPAKPSNVQPEAPLSTVARPDSAFFRITRKLTAAGGFVRFEPNPPQGETIEGEWELVQ